MSNKTSVFFRRQLDAIVYGIVGPFSVLFVIPRFFLNMERQMGIEPENLVVLKYIGIIMMNAGGILAIWCALLMYKSRKASPSPFTLPKEIITTGPFKYVRHPMMWSLHLVITGQVFVWSSFMVLLWLLIWLRFSTIYISRYEEPYLISLFGNKYVEYCKKTPRWIPKVVRFRKKKD